MSAGIFIICKMIMLMSEGIDASTEWLVGGAQGIRIHSET